MIGAEDSGQGSPVDPPERPDPERTSAMVQPEPPRTPSGGFAGSAGQGVPIRPNPLPPPRPEAASWQAPPAARPGPVVPPSQGPARAGARPVPRGKGRRARLSLRRLDPWSVFLTSLVLSICLGIMTIVAAFVLYAVLNKLGVPGSINRLVETVQGGSPVLTSSRFVGGAAVLAAVNVVLLSFLATLSALLYNVVSTFTGGLEVTLTERD